MTNIYLFHEYKKNLVIKTGLKHGRDKGEKVKLQK